MKWHLDDNGDYISDHFVIEHLPKLDEIKPYFLYWTDDNRSFEVLVDNYATLDIAKRMAVNI